MNSALPIVVFLVQAMLYSYIGFRLGEKTFKDKEDAGAWRAFRVWWFGMALNTLINALAILTLAMNISYLPLFIFYSLSSTLAAAAALWGLFSYLMYIFTGGSRSSKWIGGFYIFFALFLLVSIYTFNPIGVSMGEWAVSVQYQNTPTGLFALVYGVLLILLMSLPPILASFGMFSLYFRVQERSARYRALLVPSGIFGLFGLTYLIPLILLLVGLNTNELPWWPITIRVLGIASLLLIYFAYFPPRFVQKRLQVKTVLG